MEKKNLDYKDTVALMLSDDDKDRLRAEYQQLMIRWNRLETFLDSLPLKGEEYAGQSKLLQAQDCVMVAYMKILQIRAEIEDIELE